MNKAAFDLYGTSSDRYALEIDELFSESYFLEQWIIELLTFQRERTPLEDVLLNKLSHVSKFLSERILNIVMSDIEKLLECYYQVTA